MKFVVATVPTQANTSPLVVGAVIVVIIAVAVVIVVRRAVRGR